MPGPVLLCRVCGVYACARFLLGLYRILCYSIAKYCERSTSYPIFKASIVDERTKNINISRAERHRRFSAWSYVIPCRDRILSQKKYHVKRKAFGKTLRVRVLVTQMQWQFADLHRAKADLASDAVRTIHSNWPKQLWKDAK